MVQFLAICGVLAVPYAVITVADRVMRRRPGRLLLQARVDRDAAWQAAADAQAEAANMRIERDAARHSAEARS